MMKRFLSYIKEKYLPTNLPGPLNPAKKKEAPKKPGFDNPLNTWQRQPGGKWKVRKDPTHNPVPVREQKEKHAVLLFGRMNPPTSGHEENVNAVVQHAKKLGADVHVVASRSSGAKTKSGPNKDPLTAEQKQKHLKRAFPNAHVSVADAEHPSIFHQVKRLHKMGYTHLSIAGGGDRAGEYERIKQYHGPEGKDTEHRFKSVSVVNTGERKKGISGTDMRAHAEAGHFEKFKQGLPSAIRGHEQHAKELYNDVRKGLGK